MQLSSQEDFIVFKYAVVPQTDLAEHYGNSHRKTKEDKLP